MARLSFVCWRTLAENPWLSGPMRGWAAPEFEKLDCGLDIAAAHGLEEAVVQVTKIGAVNSWLRNQPAETVTAAVTSLRAALAPQVNGAHVTLPGAMWLVSSVQFERTGSPYIDCYSETCLTSTRVGRSCCPATARPLLDLGQTLLTVVR